MKKVDRVIAPESWIDCDLLLRCLSPHDRWRSRCPYGWNALLGARLADGRARVAPRRPPSAGRGCGLAGLQQLAGFPPALAKGEPCLRPPTLIQPPRTAAPRPWTTMRTCRPRMRRRARSSSHMAMHRRSPSPWPRLRRRRSTSPWPTWTRASTGSRGTSWWSSRVTGAGGR
jgi:hypothetical protein